MIASVAAATAFLNPCSIPAGQSMSTYLNSFSSLAHSSFSWSGWMLFLSRVWAAGIK